jgi:NitT/TauT family transport system permease protein
MSRTLTPSSADLASGTAGSQAPAGLPAAEVVARRSKRWRVWTIRAGVIVAILLAWFIIGEVGGGFFVPTPQATIVRLVQLAAGPLWGPLGQSNLSLLVGFPAGAVIGVALGSFLARSRTADRALGFYLDALMVIPTISVVPIIVIAFGLTLGGRVAVVMLFVLPMVALTTRNAVSTVDESLVQMSRSYGASPWKTWRSITFPSVLGPLASGLRIALAHGISGMIVIELVLTPIGIGGLLQDARDRFDAPTLYAVTLAILIEGFVFVGIAGYIERRVQRRLGEGPRNAS